MERHFDEQLQSLKDQLVRMSALAESMIADAVKVLVERDRSGVDTVARHEQSVNALQIEIDEVCLTLIATHQPVAVDLRFLMGVAKTNSELERLADLAVNVCDKAVDLLAMRVMSAPAGDSMARMAMIATGMVNDSLHAYVSRDVDLARAVLSRDDELDDLKVRVTADLAEEMQRDSAAVPSGLKLVLVARNLERIGDHATNIAENTIFVVQGKDIRHHAETRGRT